MKASKPILVALSGFLFAALLLASPAPEPLEPESLAEKTVSDWNRRLKKADKLLLAEKYRKAGGLISDVTHEITHRTVEWSGADRALGLASLLRAIAVAGQGEGGEAIWYWHLAAELLPELGDVDFGPYGDAGRILAAHPVGAGHARFEPDADVDSEEGDPGRFEKPKITLKIPPAYPFAQRGYGPSRAVAVRVTLTDEGIPTCPHIIDAESGVTFVYAALEALRLWTFEPAILDGQPVSAFFTLTVNYKPRG